MASTEAALIAYIIKEFGPILADGAKKLLENLLGKFSGGQVKESVGDKCWFQNDKTCKSAFKPLCQLSIEKDDLELPDLENCKYREQ